MFLVHVSRSTKYVPLTIISSSGNLIFKCEYQLLWLLSDGYIAKIINACDKSTVARQCTADLESISSAVSA